MKRWFAVIGILISIGVGLAQEGARAGVHDIENYVVYYGKGKLEALSTFDLAIIQPDTLSKEELARLKASGTLVVAYLSVGEAEPARPWYLDGRVDPGWLLSKNENWGSYLVDVNQKGWQQLMRELTGEFLDGGFDGVFLDTVDTVDAYSETVPGMVDLIKGLREAYPQALLVQNRGFTVLDELTGTIDALMFESLTGSYDFGNDTYVYADNSFLAEELAELKKRTDLVILALDYADTPATAYRAVAAAKGYGFVPAVSTILLDEIPDYGLGAGGPDDIRVTDLSVQNAGTQISIVVKVENIGLSEAGRVPVSLTVDGEQIATETYQNLGIGEGEVWRVPWESAAETATVRATAFSLSDKAAGNNSMGLEYTAETTAEEPVLPPEKQKRRPADNGPDLVATALTEPLTIDGDLSDWNEMPCTEVGTAEQVTLGLPDEWAGEGDLSSRVCYAWDANNLYVGFEVTDDAIVQAHTGSSLWRGDHVELWFDTQLQLDFASAEAGNDDFQLGLSPGDCTEAVAPDIFIWTPSRLREEYDGIEYATACTGTGYRAEMRLPASVLTGLKLETGHAIGATFDPSDTDTAGSSEQEMMLSSAPNMQWGVPTLWNNLILEGEPTVSAEASEGVGTDAGQPEVKRDLSPLQTLSPSNVPSDVTAVIGYAFSPGDVSKPITDEALAEARATVQRAASEGTLWLDADTGITNFADNFLNDPALSYTPLVEAIVDEAHKHGIKVFFYFSGSEIETLNYSESPETSIDKVYPEWMQIDQFGEPMAFLPGEVEAFWLGPDTGDAWANPLAPGYREAIMKRAEVVAAAGADGIFVDVPYYFIYEDRWADFSDESAAAFKAATGFDLPRNLANDGRAFYAWLEWRQTVWRDLLGEMKRRAQKVNPGVQIIAEEWPAASFDGILSAGYDTSVADPAIDVAAHEYGHKQDEGGAIAYDLADWQHTRDMYKWYQGMNRTNWCLCYATEAADSKAIAAITYAHQLSFWETKAPTMLDESAGRAWRKELLAWVADHAETFNGAQPVAEVALVYSNRTRNLTFGSSLETLTETQHLLDAASIPYVVIPEPNIERIHDFPYVIVPEVTYATDAVQGAVESYEGTLLLVGNSLSRDGWDENDLTLPAETLDASAAVTAIESVPLTVENGEGLFVELFKRGDATQVRVFDPNLTEDFRALPRTVTLRFAWDGETPNVSALPFMGETQTLNAVQDGDTVKVEVPVDMFTTVTIKQ